MRLASSLLIISLAWISLSAQDVQQKAAQGEKAATPEQTTTPAAVKTNDKTTADKNTAKQTNITVTGATQKADSKAAKKDDASKPATETAKTEQKPAADTKKTDSEAVQAVKKDDNTPKAAAEAQKTEPKASTEAKKPDVQTAQPTKKDDAPKAAVATAKTEQKVATEAKKPDAPAAQQKESAQTASEKSELSVARAAIALNIKDLEPENAGDTFPPEVKRLYCFTHIKGSSGASEIQHRWYWNDDLMGIVNLPIKSPNYRTYSAKTIPEGMTGEWRVAVVDSKNEEILKMLKVQIK